MLSIRLESLVKHIKITDKVIDIGCDHALLDIYLCQKKISNKIIAIGIFNFATFPTIIHIKDIVIDKNINVLFLNNTNK